MKPRSTSTIIEKTEKAELVQVEYKGKIFYRVLYNIRPNDGSGLPGHSTMFDLKDGFGDDEGAARAFFEEKKNGEQTKEEAKTEEKNEANTKFNEKQIEALKNLGFKRWTKGDKDRLYMKAWNLPNVKTIWKKNGKKCVEINGEELSYTKSSEVNYTSIYIDLADDSIHVDSSFADVLTEGVEMLLNSVSTTEETPVVKEDLTTEQTTEEAKAEEKKETDMEENKMMKITEKGKALIEKNGGILKIQCLESSGNFDYSDCKDWDEVFEKWADEVGGWNYYEGAPKESDDSEVYSAEEAKERLLEDFKKVMYETTIDECIENGDMYGIARKFGYLEEIDED